jgi:DNA primase
MPAIDYRRGRAELRLADVLALIGYRPRTRQGWQWRGPCPVHGSRSATSRCFAAHLGKNVFHCFRCGAGGNAVDLWAGLTRLPLHGAVVDLCQRLHQPVPWLVKAPATRRRDDAQPKQSPEEIRPMPAP